MNLTDRQFWLNYWESKTDLIFEVKDNFILTDILNQIIRSNTVKSALEIGGFPGHYSVYIHKKYGIQTGLLDFVIHPKIIQDLLKKNGLPSKSVDLIETDLFESTHKQQYDFVFSNGLIEHFEDTKIIIEKHLDYLANNGVLFLSLPNFRGLNGWFQRNFDKENYEKHNIKSMDIDLLRSICQSFGMKNIEVRYHGKFMLWLENYQQQTFWVKALQKTTWFLGKVFFKLIPIETKAFSPYIVLIAQK